MVLIILFQKKSSYKKKNYYPSFLTVLISIYSSLHSRKDLNSFFHRNFTQWQVIYKKGHCTCPCTTLILINNRKRKFKFINLHRLLVELSPELLWDPSLSVAANVGPWWPLVAPKLAWPQTLGSDHRSTSWQATRKVFRSCSSTLQIYRSTEIKK